MNTQPNRTHRSAPRRALRWIGRIVGILILLFALAELILCFLPQRPLEAMLARALPGSPYVELYQYVDYPILEETPPITAGAVLTVYRDGKDFVLVHAAPHGNLLGTRVLWYKTLQEYRFSCDADKPNSTGLPLWHYDHGTAQAVYVSFGLFSPEEIGAQPLFSQACGDCPLHFAVYLRSE